MCLLPPGHHFKHITSNHLLPKLSGWLPNKAQTPAVSCPLFIQITGNLWTQANTESLKTHSPSSHWRKTLLQVPTVSESFLSEPLKFFPPGPLTSALHMCSVRSLDLQELTIYPQSENKHLEQSHSFLLHLFLIFAI